MPLIVDLIPDHMLLKALLTAVFKVFITEVTVFLMLFQTVEIVVAIPFTTVVTADFIAFQMVVNTV